MATDWQDLRRRLEPLTDPITEPPRDAFLAALDAVCAVGAAIEQIAEASLALDAALGRNVARPPDDIDRAG